MSNDQPEKQTGDLYYVLEVPPTATSKVIKTSYHRLAKRWHPDLNSTASDDDRALAEQKFKAIANAYSILGDPIKRAEYDAKRASVLAQLAALDSEVEERVSEPPLGFAILNSYVSSDKYRGAVRMRNSGIIRPTGNAFSLSYTNEDGKTFENVETLPKSELAHRVKEPSFFEECVFDEQTSTSGTKSMSGYTFVSTALLGRRLRWNCEAPTWKALTEPDKRLDFGAAGPISSGMSDLRHQVERDLGAGGALAQALTGYEDRPAQIAMARAVADALERDEHLIVEASTGVGKSIAYLLPIIHSGKVALISTANKNLQEQLFYKDIPFIQQHIQPFKAALVKGMGNYLCLDRLEEERAFQQIVKAPAFRIMEELIGDPDVWDGDFDVLPHALPADVRARLTTDSDGCAWRGCPHFADCYVRRMREQARDAQVIVVNHTLLLIDAAMGGWLLPERDVVVIDEAHHLEEEATRAFTVTVTPSRVTSLLAQRRLRANADAQHVIAATEADHALWAALQRAIRFDARGRQLLDEPIQEGLRLAAAIQDVADSLVTQRPPNQDDKEQQLYEKLIKRARSLVADLRIVFGERQPEQRVYYAEQVGGQGRRAAQWGASAAPLDVRDLLREQLFDKIPTIATSATIAVNGDFSFFRSRVGLESPHEVVLPLAFDYETHALLYVPRMRLEPAYGATSGAYLDELADEMRRLVEASDGRAFLLFSSQRALAEVYGRLANELEDAGYSLVAQGQNVGRPEMLRRFRELPRAVLFGLKSFWEGVDITGEALSLVVVDKLPFDPPDDPVNEARVQQMKDEGRNWFGEYTLPLAVLRLKQGIGRLLRTKEDRGVMAILDKRLHTKSYGRQVLAALPPAHRSDQIADVRAFFGAV
jgi:Rad3-related DNA helicase/curved DNA-binding protein CbpA